MEDDAYRSWETLSCPGSVLLRQPSSARFGFYTADELRALSAKRITNAEQRDLLNRPLPGGLYDPAMGPTDAYVDVPILAILSSKARASLVESLTERTYDFTDSRLTV